MSDLPFIPKWVIDALTVIGGLYVLYLIGRWLWRRAFADRIAGLRRTWARARAEWLVNEYLAVVVVRADITRLISSGFSRLFRLMYPMWISIVLFVMTVGIGNGIRLLTILEDESISSGMLESIKIFNRVSILLGGVFASIFMLRIATALNWLKHFENFEQFQSSTKERVTRLLRDAGYPEPEIELFISDMLAGRDPYEKPE